jgi:uncharacterized protein YkwD
MRGGLATLVALVALASSASVASSHAATTDPLSSQVEARLKTLSAPSGATGTSTPQSGSRAQSTTAALESAVIERINVVRRGRGLRPLRWNRRLASAADYHSHDMAQKGYFEHDSANGTAFWRRIERFYPSRGFRSWTVGENLLWASDTYGASFAVREWMNSPPQRQNLLSRDWREVGIGALTVSSAPGAYGGRAVTIVTADFGART